MKKSQKDQLVYLYNEKGMSLTAIAKKLNMPRSTLNLHMKHLGIEKRPRGGANKSFVLDHLDAQGVDLQSICNQYSNLSDAAAKIGVHETTLQRWLAKERRKDET